MNTWPFKFSDLPKALKKQPSEILPTFRPEYWWNFSDESNF